MPTQRREEKRVEERASARGRKRERESAHTRGGERKNALWLLLLYVFSSPGPALCKLGLARSAVCSTWGPHSSPQIFFFSILVVFSLPCLLATAILDSFSLFYIPNIPPSRDGRPSYLGIGASRSFWLLPGELGWRGVLGLPLLLVSSLRVLIVVSV